MTSDSDTENQQSDDSYLLTEDFVLLGDAVNGGLYQSIRYQEYGYEHLREAAIEELESIRNMAQEALEHFEEVDDAE